MPRRSPEYMEKQRLRFCEAAMVCFRRKGVVATNLNDICEEAGLSMGALYKHFKSRDDLVVEVVRLRIARRAALLRGNSWAELRTALLRHREILEGDKFSRELRAMVDYNGRLKPIRGEAAGAILLQIEEQLTSFAASGEIAPPFDMKRTARLVSLIVDGSLANFRAEEEFHLVLQELSEFLDFAVGLPEAPRCPRELSRKRDT